jgi:hypothetical protein
MLSLGQRASILCDIYILVKKDNATDVVLSIGMDHYSAGDGFILKVYPLHNINCGNTWHLLVGSYKQRDFKTAVKRFFTNKCISESKEIGHIP